MELKHCERPEGCVCGGDTDRVRNGCYHWVIPKPVAKVIPITTPRDALQKRQRIQALVRELHELQPRRTVRIKTPSLELACNVAGSHGFALIVTTCGPLWASIYVTNDELIQLTLAGVRVDYS